MWYLRLFQIATLASAIISTLLAIYVISRKNKARPLYYFSGLMFSTALYGFSYFAEIIMPDLSSAVLALKFEYVGLTFLPFFWICLAWFYDSESSENDLKILEKQHIIFIIPIVLIFVVWTNSYHHLVYENILLRPDVSDIPLTLLKLSRGPLFWVINGILNLSALTGIIKMIYNIFHKKGDFHGQFALMLLVALFPFVAHVLLLLRMIPLNLDIVPISFALWGLLIFLSMIKIKLFNLLPIAQSMVLNAMEDGVLVVDLRNRIIECNHSARKYFFKEDNFSLGKPLNVLNEQLHRAINNEQKTSEIMLKAVDGYDYIFKITKSEIEHKLYGILSFLYILQDITQMQTYMNKLEKLASFDDLTGIFNRRHFITIARMEQIQTDRNQGYFSLVILDLDHFKSINDEYGHSCGDMVLQIISKQIQKNMRSDSFCGRYGGEEFVILLPRTTSTQAGVTIERLRKIIEETAVLFEDKIIHITASFGIANYVAGCNMSLDMCLNMADQAMYWAKEKGRNRICHYKEGV